MTRLAESVLAALRQVLPADAGAVALHEPRFTGQEWTFVKDCLDTGWVSSVGAHVDRFEAMLAETTGATYAIATVNGTAALHMALRLADVEPNDEVLVPSLSFVATANAVVYCGAVPHFVDSDERTLGMDPSALRDHLASISELAGGVCRNRQTQRRIRAVVPMHTFGHPVDLDGILAVARDYRLVVVEDAAESLGSYYRGRHTGTFGSLGTLSFNGNKTITTGGGGAILTSDIDIARRAKHLTTTTRVPHQWTFSHDEVGYNYRLPNLNAALGCAQLEQLPGFLASKRRLFDGYRRAFSGVEGATLVSEPAGCVSNYWLQTLLLDDARSDERDAVLNATNSAGLMTRPSWALLHGLPMFTPCPRAPLPVAESLERRLINLPSSAGLA